MVFPGGPVLLQSANTQFKSPCHLGDQIRIDTTVSQVVESVRVLALDMVLTNLTRDRVAAKAKVQVGLL
jgi:acyl-CoA thioesterase FadM